MTLSKAFTSMGVREYMCDGSVGEIQVSLWWLWEGGISCWLKNIIELLNYRENGEKINYCVLWDKYKCNEGLEKVLMSGRREIKVIFIQQDKERYCIIIKYNSPSKRPTKDVHSYITKNFAEKCEH